MEEDKAVKEKDGVADIAGKEQAKAAEISKS